MQPFPFRSPAFAALASLVLLVGTANAAPIAHVGALQNTNGAYLFDWRAGGRATVVAREGRVEAGVVTNGLQRVVTLDTPLSVATTSVECDEVVQLRVDTLQFGVTRLSGNESRGTSSVVPLGTTTTLTGCNAGTVVPFGALTDPGLQTQHLALSLRPGLGDLTPGSVLAGPSDDPATLDETWAADLMTVQTGTAAFAASGQVHPLSTVDGWLVLGLPGPQRAYTRILVDRRTGAEVWIGAEWAGGVPVRVVKERMVKPVAGASFGSVRQASRIWDSSFSIGSNNPFQVWLYRDGTGERVSKDLALGTETRSPLTWSFAGPVIEQRRSLGNATGVRTWVPLRNSGTTRFVMEEEVALWPDGTTSEFIKPRVNFYVDTGAATPPAPAR